MATSGPRLFHIFKLVILDKQELRLSDGSGKFQEGFGLASPEPISVFKGWNVLIGQAWVMGTLLNQISVIKEIECSDRPGLGHVLINGTRSLISPV